MSNGSTGFFREVHRKIKDTADDVINIFGSSSENDLVELTEEDKQILSNINLTEAQTRVIKKAFVEAERSLIFGVLCIIDGVSYTSEAIPDLALVNRSTGEPINQGFLHDEFYEVLSDE